MATLTLLPFLIPLVFFFFFFFLLLLLVDSKGLPLAHTFQLLPSLCRLLRARQHPAPPASGAPPRLPASHLFKPYVSSSRATFSDLDINLHKSNSTYFRDADINRAELLTRLLSTSLASLARDDLRKGEGEGKPRSAATAAATTAVFILAGVQCSFHRECRPFQKYSIASKVLAWDDAALFVETCFFRSDGAGSRLQQGGGGGGGSGKRREGNRFREDNTLAVMVAKYVFRAGKVKLEPVSVLRKAGLLVADDEDENGKEGEQWEEARRQGLLYVKGCML